MKWSALLSLFSAAQLLAAPPVVKTVPWAATDPLVPHETWSGKQIRLKGTCDSQGVTFQYTWDFGDGSPQATGAVTDRYAIEATHTYAGAADLIYTARLTVTNSGTGESDSEVYYVKVRPLSQEVQVNVAIDEGLWALHKAQTRTSSGGIDYGDWRTWRTSYSQYESLDAANVNAFEVHGHLATGSESNPYTETVARGMRSLFTFLTTTTVPSSQSNGLGTFNPDSNGNGLGVYSGHDRYLYEGGMYMDAIIASGTPMAVTTTGPAGIIGRTYKDIVQDMVDFYAYAQHDGSSGGGWRYSVNEAPDNSACQWAAIGLIPADRETAWGITVPDIVKEWNKRWLANSQDGAGRFGYTGAGSYAYGPYATTGSGLVQLSMDGLGRGNALWDKAETFICNNFRNSGTYGSNIKAYYYGLFSFVKAMSLHDPNNDGVAEPIVTLQSSSPGVLPIDWYADPTYGVAKTLVQDQNSAGWWWSGYPGSHNPDFWGGILYRYETAWAVMMLKPTFSIVRRTPIAVAKAVPNPALVGQVVTLDGSDSYHQDPALAIDSWAWDVDNNGVNDASGPFVTTSFAAAGDYPVRLTVTDNGSPEQSATTILIVRVTPPPVVPTAVAGGPYVFCPQAQPWYLDGRGSTNPDEGYAESGCSTPDTIVEYAWDLDGDLDFNDAFGPIVDVTAFYTAFGPGSYLVQLRVTDNANSSFCITRPPNLSDTDSGVVIVKASTDPVCNCVKDLVARPKSGKIQLVWTYTGADHYNVYRSTRAGGPYSFVASTSSAYSTYLDTGLVNGTMYFYVVRPAALNGDELCQSNEASATPSARLR